MNQPEAVIILNRLAEILGTSAEAIIGEYVVWHVVAAILWIVAGAMLLVWTIRWKLEEENNYADYFVPPVICKVALIIIAALCFVLNVPDLFSPRAIATHQLIQDIRGE